MVSVLSQELIFQAVKSLAPPLSYEGHKGQSGRIGLIGGSKEYTGAPYFAAITALRIGADLAHVFCPPEAAPVIKSYSPELIVHPLLTEDTPLSVESISPWLPRLHSIVIGPGLGRDNAILRTVKELLKLAKEQEKNIIIDADGLYLITNDPQPIKGYPNCILTPNKIEFDRLYHKVFSSPPSGSQYQTETMDLARALGGVTIVRKGLHDVISNGQQVLSCEEEGSPCRKGGQGDLLSGCLGVCSYWAQLAKEHNRLTLKETELPLTLLASYTSCLIVKKCARLTFKRLGRSLLACDMVDNVGGVSCELFDQ
ncbi:PREDICTED: ATP-dependent (S)-NAD(P)H-hydrate dehydratase-like isoform X2 [Amphimedon queenslandica]|uniref:ATP-dependent (S)-NAD(P)H-hydrate dehydratase n=1 Tax=Amphimedon queenslandica TaxID=400682 RepID=A0A1X7VLA1_AMPQE|nr:PREDICTED: ATP-dependent (S)-NAD(P)H-hydrate dehydratase-like isoform X2 [Amphimedon queenslandica]|eukprot:XP_019862654.1 PREDICTED: ATP-dependent (S)-NAD(P)H-hydrate dehydratase-like isoform X2 [Amphimedon queenslandica]